MTTIVSQAIDARLTQAAIFLVVVLKPGQSAVQTVRDLCGDMAKLQRAVGFREQDGELSCVTGFGSDAWDRLFAGPRPAELHPFREIKGDKHHAVSTPGDVLFHIRATRMDQCFELCRVIMERLDGVVASADEVHGFKYYDARDLLGFVDGTENPVNQLARDSSLVGAEDARFAGGSYVIVQKYLHNLKSWNALPVEQQELIIGRKKLSDIELADDVKPSHAHNVLNTITDENGVELKILRDNMPFGDASKGEYGTYFIGYACSPSRTERMLNNMFAGNPPGNYDRILDFSTAVTGSLFFCPSQDFLDDVPASAPPPTA